MEINQLRRCTLIFFQLTITIIFRFSIKIYSPKLMLIQINKFIFIHK